VYVTHTMPALHLAPRGGATDGAHAPALVSTRIATDGEWDDAVDRSPCATFFHTREWSRLWQAYTGGAVSPVARLARFDDGVEALLPAVEKAMFDQPRLGRLSPQLRTLQSGYGTTYGGWLGPEQLTTAHHEALWNWTRRFNILMVANPYDSALADADLPWTATDYTHLVDLRPGYDEVRRKWSRGHVSAVNKGARAGLTVVPATSKRQWDGYLRVYELSLQRWGNPAMVYREDLFTALASSTSGRVRLWVVEHEGTVIAGAICLYTGTTVMYWHGAFDAELQHLRAAPLLHSEIMRAAIDDGFHWYDFNPRQRGRHHLQGPVRRRAPPAPPGRLARTVEAQPARRAQRGPPGPHPRLAHRTRRVAASLTRCAEPTG
jgi:Acetyltransferase (GNAT) domain